MVIEGGQATLLIAIVIILTILTIVFMFMWWKWHNNCKPYTGISGNNYICKI